MKRRTLWMLLMFLVSSIVLFIARTNGIQTMLCQDGVVSKTKKNEPSPPLNGKVENASDSDVLRVKLRKLLEREKQMSGPFADLDPMGFLLVLNKNGVDVNQIDENTFDSSKLMIRSSKATTPTISGLPIGVPNEVPTGAAAATVTTTTAKAITTTRPKRNILYNRGTSTTSGYRVDNNYKSDITPSGNALSSDLNKIIDGWSSATESTTTTVGDFDTDSDQSDDDDSWSIKSTTTATVYDNESDSYASNSSYYGQTTATVPATETTTDTTTTKTTVYDDRSDHNQQYHNHHRQNTQPTELTTTAEVYTVTDPDVSVTNSSTGTLVENVTSTQATVASAADTSLAMSSESTDKNVIEIKSISTIDETGSDDEMSSAMSSTLSTTTAEHELDTDTSIDATTTEQLDIEDFSHEQLLFNISSTTTTN